MIEPDSHFDACRKEGESLGPGLKPGANEYREFATKASKSPSEKLMLQLASQQLANW
ncbi:Protein of unknown function [Pyronema omphalodes CBS 100304]|uniref:Uncharacterized protein n=1 Tax=Pyronema omphalodes (strain CBS 100304) TaxID=1076935 RepID=U4L7I7_PYROM|nr:Protein of unknown function [Pyronema omphalodes CBS 100304]